MTDEPTNEAIPATLDVSRETSARLDAFVNLLCIWNRTINLVAPSTIENLRDRHIADSIQLLECCPQTQGTWLDIGSGGGLPGIPLAIVAAGRAPDLKFVLVEADSRKAAFLREASRQLGLGLAVQNTRIEALAPANAQVISARAVASLDKLLYMARPHLAPDGICIFPKGRDANREIRDAQNHWKFDFTRVPSQTDPDASILIIRNLRNA